MRYMRPAVKLQLQECISQSERYFIGFQLYSHPGLVSWRLGRDLESKNSGDSIFYVRASHVIDKKILPVIWGMLSGNHKFLAQLHPEIGNSTAGPICVNN